MKSNVWDVEMPLYAPNMCELELEILTAWFLHSYANFCQMNLTWPRLDEDQSESEPLSSSLQTSRPGEDSTVSVDGKKIIKEFTILFHLRKFIVSH